MIPIPPQQQPSHEQQGLEAHGAGWDARKQADLTEGEARFGKRKSSSSSTDGFEGIERASTQDGNEEDIENYDEKNVSLGRVASREIGRTTSNALSKVTSRLTTRSLPEPPPPPDGKVRRLVISCIEN